MSRRTTVPSLPTASPAVSESCRLCLSGRLLSWASVSYTHLDVYKRQEKDFAGRIQHYGNHFWLMFDGDRLIAFVDGFVTDEADLTGEHEAEIEKIKNVFLAILRDIKKDIDNGEQPGEAVTAAMFQAMRDALAEQKQKPLSIDDVTAMIAGQIGQFAPMDEETVEMFQQFAKKMIEQVGK